MKLTAKRESTEDGYYVRYRTGWTEGAGEIGRSDFAFALTKKHRDQYEDGFTDGFLARRLAMKRLAKRLAPKKAKP